MVNSKIIRPGTLSPFLDIRGTTGVSDGLRLSDELEGNGPTIIKDGYLVEGTLANILSNIDGIMHLSNLSNLNMNVTGSISYIKLTNTTDGYNSDFFKVKSFISNSECLVITTNNSITPDIAGNWSQHAPYSLQTDINYARTDRAKIKGARFYSDIPTYVRPTDTVTNIPANLSNIASKTTDARNIIFDKYFYDVPVVDSESKVTILSIGGVKHSTLLDHTGIPCFDSPPYDGYFKSCYAEILDGYSQSNLMVTSGIHTGEKIFAITNSGLSVSPDAIELIFYSVPLGKNIETNSSPYTWNRGAKNLTIIYGYSERLDLLADDSFRKIISNNSSSGGSGSNVAADIIFDDSSTTHITHNNVQQALEDLDAAIDGYSSGISAEDHAKLRQLIHLSDSSGPFEGFVDAYRDINPINSPFPTNVIWWTSSAKVAKIVEKTIAYNSNKTPNLVSYKVYGTDGVTLISTVTDSITYNGCFESSIIRNIVDSNIIIENLTTETHKYVRQLIHLVGEGGPFEGFSSGAYKEVLPGNTAFPDSEIWYTDITKAHKIVEKLITYNANKLIPPTITYKVYNESNNLLTTSIDSINYSSIFETNRTRVII